MSTTNPDSTLTALTAELAQATPPEGVTHIGILAVKTANRTIIDAATRPNPRDLYLSLWYEGEVCCLFADSNIGKSIFAVQMAEEIARTAKVLYLDCELSDKQFQLRYCDKTTGARHIFPENLLRAEIRPEAIDPKTYDESIIRDIDGYVFPTVPWLFEPGRGTKTIAGMEEVSYRQATSSQTPTHREQATLRLHVL